MLVILTGTEGLLAQEKPLPIESVNVLLSGTASIYEDYFTELKAVLPAHYRLKKFYVTCKEDIPKLAEVIDRIISDLKED